MLNFDGITSKNGCELLHVFTACFHTVSGVHCNLLAGWQYRAGRHSDGNGSGMSFTFTDVDYIKTYVILPLYHM